MKKFTSLALVGLILSTSVPASTFKSPDILVDSKLDSNWTGLLVRKFRLLMKNNGIADPFKARFTDAVTLSDTTVKSYLGGDAERLVRDLGNMIGLNLAESQTKVDMHGFAYEVKDFKTDLKALEESADGLALSTEISASELQLGSEKLSLSVVIPTKNKTTLPVIRIDVIRPRISARQDRLINFFTKVKILDFKDSFKLQLQKVAFDKMAQGMLTHPEDIDFNYDKIIVPQVDIKIGNKKIEFSPAKIEKLLRDKHEAIKSVLLAQTASLLKEGTLTAAIKVLENHQIAKEYWLDSNVIQSQMHIHKFASSVAENHVEVRIPADFCTKKKYLQLKNNCLNNKVTETADSRINLLLHTRSLRTIKNLMETGEANIIASISEDYVNKLLVTTYDAGLWKAALEEAGIDLGPGKVVMRMDKRGDSGTLIMDVVYKPSSIEKLALGAKTIRFPLVLDLSLRVEKHDEEPVAIVRLNDVDLTDEILLKGRADVGILSNINEIPRLKSTVLKTIRKKLLSLKNKDLIELRYPELRGMGLEKVDFVSDGSGRMNAMMRLEDLIDSSEEIP